MKQNIKITILNKNKENEYIDLDIWRFAHNTILMICRSQSSSSSQAKSSYLLLLL